MMVRLVFILLGVMLTSGCGDYVRDNDHKGEVMKKINFSELYWYAIRANAAYDTQGKINELFPDTVRVANVADTEVQYFLEQQHDLKRQIISIRGTANLKNAKEDMEYIPSRNTKLSIYVHSGFDEDTKKLYADIQPHLKKDYAVVLTGHSLGAAISTLLMMYLYEDGLSVERSINFGQPKVTNLKGVKRYEFLPLTRVVDEDDVVPLVPPITLLDSIHGVYEHLGEEVLLLEGKYYAYLEKHDAERKSVGSFWKNIGHESINDHYMKNYVRSIEAKLTDPEQVPYKEREKYED